MWFGSRKTGAIAPPQAPAPSGGYNCLNAPVPHACIQAKAFGLLDALTRAGGLALEDAELPVGCAGPERRGNASCRGRTPCTPPNAQWPPCRHVVVAATHQFDKSIMQTLIKDNIDPIERVERSTLVLASSVHQVQCKELVSAAELPRLSDSSPALFIEHARADATGEEEAA